jgi:(2Fe-2S) ferredoxin
MQKTDSDYKVHVFVCTNEKKGECCGPKGADELRKNLKEWSREHPEWNKRIRINNSGCLDRCTQGVAVAIYPQNEWYICAEPKDADNLKARIESLMNDEKVGK